METPISGRTSFSERIRLSLKPNGKAAIFQIHDSSNSIVGVKRFPGNCVLSRRFSPVGFLKNLGNRITTVYRLMSVKKKCTSKESLSARKSVDPVDEHDDGRFLGYILSAKSPFPILLGCIP
ncbi:hypothetical protein Ancab_007382 [Ancistrocladus abbreviatus]